MAFSTTSSCSHAKSDDEDAATDPIEVADPLVATPQWARQTLQVVGSLLVTLQTPGRCDFGSRKLHMHSLLQDHCLSIHYYIATTIDPQAFKECTGISEWDTVMQEEFNSLMRNHTWDLVPLPPRIKIVRCKWIS